MPDVGDEVREEVKVEEGRGAGRGRGSFFGPERLIHLALLVVGAAAIALIFRKLQYATQSICCGDFDGYYHIRWSRLLWEGMREGHFPPNFNWLPLTTLNPHDYVDHHLFFHFLQIPFTWFGDLRAGAKVAALLYASLAVFSCYWLIVRYRIRHTLIWLVALLASSAPFLYRLNMAKAPPVAIIFMVLGIYVLFEKRYLVLLPLAFIFAWTYSLFITLPGMALIWACVIGWSERRFEWRPVVWTLTGTVAGLVINPYFPKNIFLFAEHVAMKVAPLGFKIEVGGEWYPYNSWELLGSCAVAFCAMVVGYVAYEWSDRRRAARPLFLMCFSTLLMIACFWQKRWAEYWPPLAVLFAAFSLKPLLEGVRASITSRLPSDVMEELQPFLDRNEPPGLVEGERRERFWGEAEVAGVGIVLGLAGYYVLKEFLYPSTENLNTLSAATFKIVAVIVGSLLGFAAYVFWRRSAAKAFGVVLVFILVLVLNVNVRETRLSIAGDAGPERYESAMAWIRENVPAGETIFNTDWDDFPKMFYYDTRHAYVSGLDPTYLLDRDARLRREPKLAELYKELTLGHDVTLDKQKQEYGPLIREKFGARYVFSDNNAHDDFYVKATESGWFEQIHIYTFERKDGRILTPEDLDRIKQNAPPEMNNWTAIAGDRRLVTGTTADFTCTDVNGLCEAFTVNKDIDSLVFRIRDQKGEPPPEAQEEMGDEPDDGGDEEQEP